MRSILELISQMIRAYSRDNENECSVIIEGIIILLNSDKLKFDDISKLIVKLLVYVPY